MSDRALRPCGGGSIDLIQTAETRRHGRQDAVSMRSGEILLEGVAKHLDVRLQPGEHLKIDGGLRGMNLDAVDNAAARAGRQ